MVEEGRGLPGLPGAHVRTRGHKGERKEGEIRTKTAGKPPATHDGSLADWSRNETSTPCRRLVRADEIRM